MYNQESTCSYKHALSTVLSGHSKIDKIFKTNGSLMKVESIAECSLGNKQYSVLKTIFGLLFEWPLKTGFTVFYMLFSLFELISCQVNGTISNFIWIHLLDKKIVYVSS